jgi:hypothetical protein
MKFERLTNSHRAQRHQTAWKEEQCDHRQSVDAQHHLHVSIARQWCIRSGSVKYMNHTSA